MRNRLHRHRTGGGSRAEKERAGIREVSRALTKLARWPERKAVVNPDGKTQLITDLGSLTERAMYLPAEMLTNSPEFPPERDPLELARLPAPAFERGIDWQEQTGAKIIGDLMAGSDPQRSTVASFAASPDNRRWARPIQTAAIHRDLRHLTYWGDVQFEAIAEWMRAEFLGDGANGMDTTSLLNLPRTSDRPAASSAVWWWRRSITARSSSSRTRCRRDAT